MTEFIRWAAFFGGWLLFAGPLFQAAVELREIEFDREAYEELEDAVGVPGGRVSPWWWLAPPVAYLKIQRKERERRTAVLDSMDASLREQAFKFLSTARGWLLVASGAFLIGLKETWELVEHYHWAHWTFFALAAAGALAGLLNTAASTSRAQQLHESDS